VAVATILHLPTSPFLCGCYDFQPACVAQVWVLRTGRAYVCERRWRYRRISVCFWRLCGYLHGATGCCTGEGGLGEH
jgi:hypothetical protein